MNKIITAIVNLIVASVVAGVFGVIAYNALTSAWLDNAGIIAFALGMLLFVLSFAIAHKVNVADGSQR